jgi:hypothetical protein
MDGVFHIGVGSNSCDVQMLNSSHDQYSQGLNMVVHDLSLSVMIQIDSVSTRPFSVLVSL